MASLNAIPAPPGYDPGLTVSTRQQPEGGGVCHPAQLGGRTPAAPRRELLVLLHGFNNHLTDAETVYVAFRDGQGQRLPAPTWAALQAALADAFWPGDGDFPGPLDKLDFLVYPVAVGRAKDAAQALAACIAGRRDVFEVHFVAHSLGCRVALETVRALQAMGSAQAPQRIGRMCLMAAAVPLQHVGPGGDLRDAVLAPRELRLLYSTEDRVLQLAFPAGQTAAGDGFMPEAVGRHGTVPGAPAALEALPVPGAGHSDYWGAPQFVGNPQAAALAQQLLAAFIGRDGLDRELPARPDAPTRGQDTRTLAARGVG